MDKLMPDAIQGTSLFSKLQGRRPFKLTAWLNISLESALEDEGGAETAVNGAYLRQALKALGGMAELKVKDPQSPMLFLVDGYRLVIMPVAIGIGKKDGEGKPETVAEAKQVAEQAEAVAENKPKRPSVRRTKAKEPVPVA